MKKNYSIFTNKFGIVNKSMKFAEGDNVFLSQSIRIWLELILIIFGALFCLFSIKSGIFFNVLPLLGGLAFGVYRLMPLILKAYSGFATIMGAKESFTDVLNYMTLENKSSQNSVNLKFLNFKEDLIFNNVSYNYPKRSSKY